MTALALLLFFQSLNVATTLARGPLHTHREPILVDFRRDIGQTASRHDGISAWFGHHHGMALRHHHGADDPSVFMLVADRAADLAAEDGGLALDLGITAFVALISTWVIGSFEGLSHKLAPRRRWEPTTGWRPRLERPPQLA